MTEMATEHPNAASRTYDQRCLDYLEAEAAAERPLGNGRAEVFHQIARLELGRSPISEPVLRASLELINARRDCADFALAGALRLLYRYPSHPLLAPEMRAELEGAAQNFCY